MQWVVPYWIQLCNFIPFHTFASWCETGWTFKWRWKQALRKTQHWGFKVETMRQCDYFQGIIFFAILCITLPSFQHLFYLDVIFLSANLSLCPHLNSEAKFPSSFQQQELSTALIKRAGKPLLLLPDTIQLPSSLSNPNIHSFSYHDNHQTHSEARCRSQLQAPTTFTAGELSPTRLKSHN